MADNNNDDDELDLIIKSHSQSSQQLEPESSQSIQSSQPVKPIRVKPMTRLKRLGRLSRGKKSKSKSEMKTLFNCELQCRVLRAWIAERREADSGIFIQRMIRELVNMEAIRAEFDATPIDEVDGRGNEMALNVSKSLANMWTRWQSIRDGPSGYSVTSERKRQVIDIGGAVIGSMSLEYREFCWFLASLGCKPDVSVEQLEALGMAQHSFWHGWESAHLRAFALRVCVFDVCINVDLSVAEQGWYFLPQLHVSKLDQFKSLFRRLPTLKFVMTFAPNNHPFNYNTCHFLRLVYRTKPLGVPPPGVKLPLLDEVALKFNQRRWTGAITSPTGGLISRRVPIWKEFDSLDNFWGGQL